MAIQQADAGRPCKLGNIGAMNNNMNTTRHAFLVLHAEQPGLLS